jgi:hypothetical protein
MKCNVGSTEGKIRIILGAVILLLGVVFKSWWGLIGIAPIITGSIGWCPVSVILGINTCKGKDDA